jgi:hypothetical protein
MANPDLSLLAAYPGEYSQDLISALYNALRLEQEGISIIPGVKNKINLHKMWVKKGAKPYTGSFVNKDGDVYLEPRVLSVEKVQRDLEINPDKYRPTFAAYLRGKGENANNLTIPFAQFMWEAVVKELATEINLETVYNGVGTAGFTAYAAGTAYTVGSLITYVQGGETRYFRCIIATSAGQNPDTNPNSWDWAGARAITKGFGKIIADEITAGKLVAVATGAVTNVNAYSKFVQMYRSLPEAVKLGIAGQAIIYCSMTDYEYLTDDYETQVSKNFETVDGITYLAKTDRRCQIKPVSWLSGSRRLIATVVGNLSAGTDEISDMNEIRTVQQVYSVQAGITFVIGFQINDLEVLKVSDQV